MLKKMRDRRCTYCGLINFSRMRIIASNKGFTLIELIIVITVLGVLSAIALPQYVNFKTDAQAASNVGYIGGLRSTLAISSAANILGKAACVSNVNSGTPTNALIESCVSGTRPTSLTQNAAGWQGIAPGNLGSNMFWVITAGTATTPSVIACSTTTPAITAPGAGIQC